MTAALHGKVGHDSDCETLLENTVPTTTIDSRSTIYAAIVQVNISLESPH